MQMGVHIVITYANFGEDCTWRFGVAKGGKCSFVNELHVWLQFGLFQYRSV